MRVAATAPSTNRTNRTPYSNSKHTWANHKSEQVQLLTGPRGSPELLGVKSGGAAGSGARSGDSRSAAAAVAAEPGFWVSAGESSS